MKNLSSHSLVDVVIVIGDDADISVVDDDVNAADDVVFDGVDDDGDDGDHYNGRFSNLLLLLLLPL